MHMSVGLGFLPKRKSVERISSVQSLKPKKENVHTLWCLQPSSTRPLVAVRSGRLVADKWPGEGGFLGMTLVQSGTLCLDTCHVLPEERLPLTLLGTPGHCL